MPKWNPIYPHEFCYCLSLQAGVVGSSVSGITLMLITTVFSIYAPNKETSPITLAIQYILLGVYLLIMYAGFILAFLAAFWEISKFVRIAAVFVSLGLLCYFSLSLISFLPVGGVIQSVCPGLRCPDHHWLLDARWRHVIIGVAAAEVPNEIVGSNVTGGTNEADDHSAMSGQTEGDEPISYSVLFMVISVINTLALIGFMVYSVLTFLAFAKELDIEKPEN